jgi:hypothetical protein
MRVSRLEAHPAFILLAEDEASGLRVSSIAQGRQLGSADGTGILSIDHNQSDLINTISVRAEE